MSVHRIIIAGNLTKDPEVRYSQGGVAITRFGVAVNESVKRDGKWEKHTEYFNCVSFGKQAENIAQYLSKGSAVTVEGKIRTRKHEDKYYVDLIVDNSTFQSAAKGKGEQKERRSVKPKAQEEVDAENIEDELPF